jgi:hypothetical protein
MRTRLIVAFIAVALLSALVSAWLANVVLQDPDPRSRRRAQPGQDATDIAPQRAVSASAYQPRCPPESPVLARGRVPTEIP